MRMRSTALIGGALLVAASLCLAQAAGKAAKPKGKAAAPGRLSSWHRWVGGRVLRGVAAA